MIRLKIFLKTHLPALYTLIRKATFLSYLFFRSQKIKKLGEKTVGKVSIGKMEFPILLSKKNGFVDEEIFWKGCYEEEVLLAMQEILQANNTFVDIGANIGEHSLLAAHIVIEGKVISFEPLPLIYSQLQESIKLNSLNNITVHNVACGTQEEKKVITINQNNVGGSSMVTTGKTEDELTINVVKGDSILLNETRIDLIKIDTEGYEYEVLLGIEETIKKFQPKILLEFSPSFYNLHEETKENGKKILEFLKAHNYSITGIDIILEKQLIQTEKILELVKDQANFLCIPA